MLRYQRCNLNLQGRHPFQPLAVTGGTFWNTEGKGRRRRKKKRMKGPLSFRGKQEWRTHQASDGCWEPVNFLHQAGFNRAQQPKKKHTEEDITS